MDYYNDLPDFFTIFLNFSKLISIKFFLMKSHVWNNSSDNK